MSAPRKLIILLVEDEPADAHLVRLAFEEGKILVELHHVSDGIEAFAFLRHQGSYASSPTPDLILLDLNMPRMDGRTFLQRLKVDEPLQGLPVVVLTTSDAERDMLDSYNHFAAGFIVKPVDVDDFIHVVRGISDYWINIVRLPEHNRTGYQDAQTS